MMIRLIVATLVSLTIVASGLARDLREHLGPQVPSRPDGISERDMRELASLVREHGFRVNLEVICKIAELEASSENCRFRQISIGLHTKEGDVLSFNVPEGPDTPFVVMFHISSDLAEVFLVSGSGELMRAYYLNGDGRFAKIDDANLHEVFKIDAAYWARNIGAVYDGLRVRRPPHRQ